MGLPDKYDVIPTKCAKCGNERIIRHELSMHGRWGFWGRACIFDVYVCGNCGYAELFLKKSSWI